MLALQNPIHVLVGDSQATALILADEPSVSIADGTVVEVDSGTSTMTFTLTLSAPATVPVASTYLTSDSFLGYCADTPGTPGTDYVKVTNGVVIFGPVRRPRPSP